MKGDPERQPPEGRKGGDAAVRIGFVGYGEVASAFAQALLRGGAEVTAYDVLLDQTGGFDVLAGRTCTDGVRFAPLAEVVGGAEYILATVTTRVAKAVAEGCVPLLRPGQVYVDLNSTAPSVKVEIASIIGESGADFVEGVILGAVGATGARTEILTGGKKGDDVAGRLSALGLNVRYYGPEIGKASMFKMLRSIVSKGLEALMLEMLIAGKRAGIGQDLWRDITGFLTSNPFDRVASNWIQSHALAYERRYHEMVQVADTLGEIGVEPIMTAGTVGFFERSCHLGLTEAFPKKPLSPDEVVEYMEKKTTHADGGDLPRGGS